MFALIETKNATHIAIHIPADKAAASLPALANMLENNAVFIQQSYREAAVVSPGMSIVLGNTYSMPNNDGEAIVIGVCEHLIADEFVIDTPEVFRSNKEYRAKKEAELTNMRREVDSLRLQVERLTAALTAATNPEEVA